MLYLMMILACAALALAWSVDDFVTMAFAGVLFLVAAALKIGGRTFGKYVDRQHRSRAAWRWPYAVHDPFRLVELSRGELIGDELLEALRHLQECDECADKFRVVVMLRAAVAENPGIRHASGDPRRLM